MADTLQGIQTKVRRLTRSMSESVLSTVDLNDYINTFVLYDMPEHLRLFDLRTQFTFYCNPYQDVYVTDTTLNVNDPLYNFKNLYISVHPPLYIAGFEAMYTQSREQLFGVYPGINFIQSIGVAGNGITQTFTGVVPNSPFLQNQVLFSSIDTMNNGLSLIDVPTSNSAGNLVVPGTATVQGTVNYVTGAFTLTFPTAPGSGQPINSQTVPYVPQIPLAMLYYDDKFTLRPVPDQPYRINFEVFKRPTQLIASNQVPELEQWWQYIAYGAAKKVLEDRMDLDSVALILPEFLKQQNLVLRRTLIQYANQRVATIYTEQTSVGYNNWGIGGAGGNL
ncbi:MAG: hypothetical protein ACHQVS_00540 [Candidatus Babeliales bacterium]